MAGLQNVDIAPLQPERFESILGEAYAEFAEAITAGRALFEDRVIWNVNSTAKGGGVAEMLRSLIAYARGGGVDARWVVVQGNPDFFRVTKRVHNHLHGAEGDRGELGPAEREIYEQALGPNAEELAELVSPGDIVILHDPQTAGLCTAMKDAGATVLWRCHVGLDTPNETARNAWNFLRPFLSKADSCIFSREAFVWEDLADEKIEIIPPSIDAFSPKNQDMTEAEVDAVLAAAGITSGTVNATATFLRIDGSEGRIVNRASMSGAGTIPSEDGFIVQVSRWDRLKDPIGVMEGFARYVAPASDARLLLAGPAVEEVADDPEGAEVLREVEKAWAALDAELRERIHLVCLPMDDGEENAAMVNALQRKAIIVVQKSLAEGFGLTVAEGMWKAKPVIASRIGGIQDQIEHGVTGILLDDPRDREEFGRHVLSLLQDSERAAKIGVAARERVRTRFLGARHLMQYLELIRRLL